MILKHLFKHVNMHISAKMSLSKCEQLFVSNFMTDLVYCQVSCGCYLMLSSPAQTQQVNTRKQSSVLFMYSPYETESVLSMRGIFYRKMFSNLKIIYLLIWKRTEHIPACRHLYRVRLCWAGRRCGFLHWRPRGLLYTSPSLPSLHQHFHIPSLSPPLSSPPLSAALLPLQLCFKCSILHLLSLPVLSLLFCHPPFNSI